MVGQNFGPLTSNLICDWVSSLFERLSSFGRGFCSLVVGSSVVSFTPVNEDKAVLLNRCVEFVQNCGINVSDSDLQLPLAYWTPKMHKTPPSTRFITSCRNTVTSGLSNVVGVCLSRILKTDKNMSRYKHKYKDYHDYFIIDNRNEVIKYMKDSNGLGRNGKSVKTYDFKTLYTSIPHDKLKDVVYKYIKKVFHEKGKKYIVTSGKSSYFSNRRDNNKVTFTADGLIEQVKFIIDNAYVEFNSQIFRQIIGIPMGTNCGPYLANIFLHFYEYDFIDRMVANEEWEVLRSLHALFRYQDDCLVFEDNNVFSRVLSDIYPVEMEIENTNISTSVSTYLDLQISVHRGKYNFKLFDKRKDFNFDVINYPFLPSNVPKNASYGVFISQLIRLCQVNSNIHGLKRSFKELCQKFLKQGFEKCKLINRYEYFAVKYANLWTVFGYDISSTNFIKDVFK